MKLSTSIIAIMMVALTSNMYGQKTVHKYIDKIKMHKDAYAFTVPGWLVRTGLRAAIDEDIKDSQGYKDIVDGIKQLRFVVVDNGDVLESGQVTKMLNDFRDKDGMVDYVKVKEDGNEIFVIYIFFLFVATFVIIIIIIKI